LIPTRRGPFVASFVASFDPLPRWTTPTMPRPLATAILSTAAALLVAMPAAAQSSALGGGRALDRNLQHGAGRANPRAFEPDYRARNEDVTGTLAGGRSFRGDVGYRPSGDFAGRVGDDSIYRWQRFSAFSAPSFFMSPLSNDQYRMAEGMGQFQYRRDYATLPLYTSVGQVRDIVDAQIRLDRSNAALMTGNLYSTAVSVSQMGLLTEAERGPAVVLASPLRGVQAQALSDPLMQAGLAPFERARMVQDLRAGEIDPQRIGEPFQGLLAPTVLDSVRAAATGSRADEQTIRRVERQLRAANLDQSAVQSIVAELRLDIEEGRVQRGDEVSAFLERRLGTQAPSGRMDLRPDGTDQTYARIVERVVRQYADRGEYGVDADADVLDEVRSKMELLRQRLRGDITFSEADDEEAAEGAVPGMPRVLLPGERLRDPDVLRPGFDGGMPGDAILPGGTAPLPAVRRAPGLGDPTIDPQEAMDAAGLPGERILSIEEMALILRHGRLVDSLTDGDRTRLDELIADAQGLLAQGDYFRAERRFDAALRLQPNQPMASAGIANAQLGAGLYLSAGLTLRRLFSDYPEMIDVRYAPDLLPSPARLRAVSEALRLRIDAGRDLAGYGLLLAYTGHQLDDREIVVDGLLTMDTSGDASAQPLADLLRAVWLPQAGK
jgi:hypothetical protein